MTATPASLTYRPDPLVPSLAWTLVSWSTRPPPASTVIPWLLADTSTLLTNTNASTVIAVSSTAWIVTFAILAPLWHTHSPVPGSLLPSMVILPPPSIRIVPSRSGSAVAVVTWIVPLTSKSTTVESNSPAGHSPGVVPDSTLWSAETIASRREQLPSSATSLASVLTVIGDWARTAAGAAASAEARPPARRSAPMRRSVVWR